MTGQPLIRPKIKTHKKLCKENGIKYVGTPVSKPVDPGRQTTIIIIYVVLRSSHTNECTIY